mgnify:FL=1
MPDAVAEIIAAVGEAVTKDSEFMDEGEETTNPVVRVMFYLIPMSILTGFYIWTVYQLWNYD